MVPSTPSGRRKGRPIGRFFGRCTACEGRMSCFPCVEGSAAAPESQAARSLFKNPRVMWGPLWPLSRVQQRVLPGHLTEQAGRRGGPT